MDSELDFSSIDNLPIELINALEDFDRQSTNSPDTHFEDFLDRVHAAHRGQLLWHMIECVEEHKKLDHDGFLEEVSLRKAQFPEYAEQLHECLKRRLRKKGPPIGTPCISPEIYSQLVKHKEGGQGVVYKAIQTKTGMPVALKVMWASGNEQRTHEATEANLLRGLRDERIVRLIEYFHNITTVNDEDVDVLVEEWIDGPSLRDHFENSKRKLSATESVRIIIQVLEGLSCIHANEIFHLDLKLSNVVLRGIDLRPVIVDFGGSVRRRHRHEKNVFTPEYLAPERLVMSGASRKCHVSARTDIYSVGVILYQLLTGGLPFNAKNEEELGRLFDDGNPPDSPRSLVPGISKSLDWICLKCLALDQNDRYASAQDLLDALSIVPEAIPPRSPRQTVEQRILKLLPMEQRDRPFYESLINVASQKPQFSNSDSLIENLRSNATDAPKIIALSAPSGAGKSSWLRAWLLPELLLSGAISVCRLDASEPDNSTSERTVDFLHHELRVHLSAASIDGTEISTAVELIREVVAGRLLSKSVKLLIVIDQFEQWLLRYGRNETSNLLNILQECDGRRVQALLLFRSGHENLIKPVMRRCDQAFHDGTNAFELPTATKPAAAAETLLQLLGAAGRFQEASNSADLSALRQSAERLLGTPANTEILPVQIVLLAKYCLCHIDAPDPLAQVQNFDDIVRLHVDELFEKSIATPVGQQLLLSIIRQFLPAGSSQRRQPTAFDNPPDPTTPTATRLQDLLDYLKSSGVIMPVATPADVTTSSPSTFWQLTHEFWIDPLRHWVDRQPQTEREKLLWKLADRWQHDRRPGNLPKLTDYLLVRRTPCHSAHETEFLAACRRHFARRAIIFVGLALGVITAATISLTVDQRNLLAKCPINSLVDLPQVSPLIELFVNTPKRVRERLLLIDPNNISDRIPCHIMLLRHQSVSDPQNDDSIQFLLKHLPQVSPPYQKLLISLMTKHRNQVLPRLTGMIKQLNDSVFNGHDHSLAAHLAIIAVLLERPDDAQNALGTQHGDQSASSEFISRFPEWAQTVEWPAAVPYERIKDYPRLLSAILHALDIDSLYEHDALKNLVEQAQKHTQAGVAMIASHMIKRIHMNPENKESKVNSALQSSVTDESSSVPPLLPPPGSNWIIDKQLDMIFINTGIDSGSGIPLWVSDTEITWGNIRKLSHLLLPDEKKNDKTSDNLPANNLDPIIIFSFINSLNQVYKHPPTYRKIGEETEGNWEPIPSARGFRLASVNEHQKMVPAVGPNFMSLGKQLGTRIYSELLPKYANITSFRTDRSPNVRLFPVRSLRPNLLGISDLLGNCNEIVVCDDERITSDKGSLFGEKSKLCTVGGDCHNDAYNTFINHIEYKLVDLKDVKSEAYGFRVVFDGPLLERP